MVFSDVGSSYNIDLFIKRACLQNVFDFVATSWILEYSITFNAEYLLEGCMLLGELYTDTWARNHLSTHSGGNNW